MKDVALTVFCYSIFCISAMMRSDTVSLCDLLRALKADLKLTL